jgi:hypothetical protein
MSRYSRKKPDFQFNNPLFSAQDNQYTPVNRITATNPFDEETQSEVTARSTLIFIISHIYLQFTVETKPKSF